jgi:oxygen-independent coproporphyrinogen-3 oxidase
MSAETRALYIHIPFCRRICGYCDFYHLPLAQNHDAVPRLVDALIAELRLRTEHVTFHPKTIFIGGGTPTTLPPEQLRRLLATCLEFGTPDEFTVEANPATINDAVAETLATGGVNRISVGAQSFNRGELQFLDRDHQPDQVAQTLETCRRHGLTNLSLDLIFGIPGQDSESWSRSLATAVDLGPQHLSCYGLTYEPGTTLHNRLQRGAIERMENNSEANLYEQTINQLAGAGFEQYEISNFARDGRVCLHNLVYWRNEAYLGIGPSAAGYIQGQRYKNIPDLAEYVRHVESGALPTSESESLDPTAAAGETAMLGLRLIAGLDRDTFAKRFGQDPVVYFAPVIAKHGQAGHLEVSDSAIHLTRSGLLLCDMVIADFLSHTDAS